MSVDELIHKLAEWPGNFEVYAHNINGDQIKKLIDET